MTARIGHYLATEDDRLITTEDGRLILLWYVAAPYACDHEVEAVLSHIAPVEAVLAVASEVEAVLSHDEEVTEKCD